MHATLLFLINVLHILYFFKIFDEIDISKSIIYQFLNFAWLPYEWNVLILVIFNIIFA